MDVSLDFETYCQLDLTKVGLRPYVTHPSFEVLMTAMALGNGEVMWWRGLPYLVIETLSRCRDVRWKAYNAPFEMAVLRSQGIEVPAHRWRCTMAHAYARGFSGTMAQVGAQVGVAEDASKLDGRSYINRFCKPAPRNHKVDRYTAENDPDRWAKFREYNKRDVVAERAISRYLAQWPWTPEEQSEWEMDRRINARGIPVDVGYAERARQLSEGWKLTYARECRELTDGISPSQTAKLLQWCRAQGYPHNHLQAEAIRRYLPEAQGVLAEVLHLRLSHTQSAAAKYAKIGMVQMDGRIPDTLLFRGASRTGRYSGRNFQPQNLRRPPKDVDPDKVAETVLAGEFDAEYGGPKALDILGGCIRASIRAPPGKTLVVADLSAIESRVLGWVSGDRDLMSVFLQGHDPYKSFAARWFFKDYDSVTKEERTLAKPAVLGGGYGLGGKGLRAYADSMGIAMTEEEAQSSIDAFRKTYARIPVLWRFIENAFVSAAAGFPVEGYRMCFDRVGDMTRIRLPSGRYLHYQRVRKEDGEILYNGQNQYTHQWEDLRTYGAKLVENIVQAISLDILVGGLRNCESFGLPVVFHLHDEIVVEVSEEQGDEALQRLIAAMTKEIPWAPRLPLAAAGYVALRHRKD